jgi:hypothetical protein
MLNRINGGVAGYDVDKQYAILVKTIEIERIVAAETGRDGFWAICKGVDGVRQVVVASGRRCADRQSRSPVANVPNLHSAWSSSYSRSELGEFLPAMCSSSRRLD